MTRSNCVEIRLSLSPIGFCISYEIESDGLGLLAGGVLGSQRVGGGTWGANVSHRMPLVWQITKVVDHGIFPDLMNG